MKENRIIKDLLFGIVILIVLSSAISSSVEVIDSDDFDNKIENLMELGHMPSLVACIVKNNTTAWSKAYGFSHFYREINSTVDTVYPIASVTKSITATAIMQIIENESYDINLDDNVSEYLPFNLKNPRYPEVNITYRMLLAHQSSLRENFFKFVIYNRILNNPDNWLKKFFNNPRNWYNYAPGEGVCYSIGTIILGLIIENVTNQSYEDYCREHIFNPLKMWNTSFYFPDFDKNNLACPYLWIGGKLFPYLLLPYIQVPAIEFPFGGLKSTVLDLSHYLIMHTSGGVYNGVRVLNESSVEEMHRDQYPGYYDSGFFHGLGWYGNETYGGHSGSAIGGKTVIRMRYSDKVGVIYFWNQNSFLRSAFHRLPQNEKDAIKGVEMALFEKADEL